MINDQQTELAGPPRVIAAGEYMALDTIWNTYGVKIDEPGSYRVYAALR